VAANEVVDRDLGWSNLARELGSIGQPGVYVGILQDRGSEVSEDGEITLAGYAAVNEFGSEDGRVPERSFLRSTVDDNQATYEALLADATGDAVDAMIRSTGTGAGLASLERSLGRLGIRVQRDVQDRIRAGGTPSIPNAPLTLARKYPATHPLIHTGRMRQSISFKVDLKGEGPK
jgi:phage gpG-like protein